MPYLSLPFLPLLAIDLTLDHRKKESENAQEIPQSHTADQPTAP